MSRNELVRHGAASVIYDSDEYPRFDPACFDGADWRRDPVRLPTNIERGAVLLREAGEEIWVRRHYHRGGLVARLVYDEYLWIGIERTRAFREWRLLKRMRELALPVPTPVAARVVRSGLLYRADLITVLLPGTRPLSSLIAAGDIEPAVWSRIGAMLARFHGAHIDHPDLTAHNILLGVEGQTYLLDFDNAAVRPGSGWCAARLARLRRSLAKVALETGAPFDEAAWQSLLAAYGSR